MKEPGIIAYALLIAVCLVFTVAGLYMLANFSRLLRSTFKNELLRKNIAAWLIIFCISVAMVPMSGGFFYLLQKHGWGWAVGSQFISATACTLIIYNLARLVAENRRLKRLSFLKHTSLIVFTLIITTLSLNIPLSYWMYGKDAEPYMKYVLSNSVYLAAATGIVYSVINYLDIERKRKFSEKELELSLLRELKTKAELDALHSKINPHFLYNALNSIADLAITDGKKARKMTVALADLFRYSINYSDHNYSSIKDEVEMAEVYLLIEKIRFEDKLTYSLNVDNELKHYLVPRFVLQPVVENAVKHGLKATGKMTEIVVEVKKSEQGLQLIVADNGPLFPQELSPGYGVKSMFDKLDLLFPGQYEVHYSNEPRKQVSIHIQKLMKDEQAV
jgi:two-component system, LytTR family, sensor kinase